MILAPLLFYRMLWPKLMAHSQQAQRKHAMFAWSCLPHAGGKCESQHRDWWLPAISILHLCQTSETLWLPETRISSSTPQETDYLHAEMDGTQIPHGTEDRAPLFMPESPTRRPRLRAIAAGGENLYEPPNTAEASARLEAAIDEVKFHGSMSEGQGLLARRQHLKAMVATYRDLYEPPDTAEAFARLEAAIDEVKRHGKGGDEMLDPPTTAERFNRIENAIDEVLDRTKTAIGTTQQAKRSTSDPDLSTWGVSSDHHETANLLKKRQLQFADQIEPSSTTFLVEKPWKDHGSPGPTRRSHGYFFRRRSLRPLSEIFKPSNPYDPKFGKPDTITHSAVEFSISEAEGIEPNHDVDVFQDDDSVKAFANQTYQTARERHL
jgi:hypothetical protein